VVIEKESSSVARGPSNAKQWRAIGDVGAVGIELVVSIALCYWVGHWADQKWFHDRGWVTFAGFVFGVVVGFKAIFDASKRAQKRIEIVEREEREAREAERRERDLLERRRRDIDHDDR
jgi:hypothetical protein